MKIGLACSGSGPGAKYANLLAQELETLSLCPEMISCTSLPSVPMLLWSRGLSLQETEKRISVFTKAQKMEKSLARVCMALPETRRCRLALCSTDLDTGVAVVWADGLDADAWNLKIFPLTGAEKEAVQATMCLYSQRSGQSETIKLCDFSARFGSPLFPLKMAGMERVLSVVFIGASDPAGVAAESLSILTGKNADLHYAIRLSPGEGPETLRNFIHAHKAELYEKLLF